MSNTTASGFSASDDDESKPEPPINDPEQVGPYKIQRRLGSGGMGTVYLGVREETQEEVAVKVLPASMAREAGFVARFDREIEAMSKLNSSHIVQLFESGEDDGTYFYSMEYVEGETLTDRLERDGRLRWQEVIEIGVQICTALKAAHNTGIIHRDLKPSNLLIAKDGTVKLTDFGVAQVFATNRLTVTGGVLGTAEYMSPEQSQGKRVTKQSDLYSLGAVLYVMLTGRPPFRGKTILEILQKHKFSQFDSVRRIVPEVPHWLDEIVCQCLAKNPEDRFPDAYVLSLRLQEVPKKIELRSNDASRSSLTGTEETIVDESFRDEEFVGGTLVRDLFRAQVEAEKEGSLVSRLFDNPIVLVGLLIAMIAGGYGWTKLNQLSEEEMYQRGVDLMAKPEGVAWDAAEVDYFEPLLEMDASRWETKVTPYLSQIEVYQLKKELLGRDFSKQQFPDSDPRGIVKQAMELRRQGEVARAIEKLLSLKLLLVNTDSQKPLVRLIDGLVAEMSGQSDEESLEYIADALDRADQLFEKGEVGSALGIWLSVKSLYDQHPNARQFVERAEEDYLAATGIDLNSVTPPFQFEVPQQKNESQRETHGPESEDP